ncbi:hypothetical protein [Ornithinimicrobium flavum]|uniref:hypothetical protein n=1 Tax=Ornithinimicrobium flavum TaxID=1288636 RepID=UPI00187DF8F3|nr:hypothetical protein [Ornithinimicrobium flavum]
MALRPPVRTTRPPRATRPSRPPGAGPARLGLLAAVGTGVLTVVTFGLALTALPDRVPYPFTDPVIARQWPGDYLWMYPAMVLLVVLVALVAALTEVAPPERRVHGRLAFALTTLAAGVLLVDYYLQVTVLPLSLEKGQLDGWSMLTQYNPNGVFLALEELGYLLLSLALLCLVPVLAGASRVERALRVLLLASTGAVVLALVAVSLRLGTDRGDTFEIAIISIVWVTLLVASPLLAVLFRRRARLPGPEGAPRDEDPLTVRGRDRLTTVAG